jgi:hypothetical protein
LKEARKNKAEWNKSNVLRPIIKRWHRKSEEIKATKIYENALNGLNLMFWMMKAIL